MSEMEKKRWQTLIQSAREAVAAGGQSTEVPLDLLLSLDLELCALEALCGLRGKRSGRDPQSH